MSGASTWPLQLAAPSALRDGTSIVAFGDEAAERLLAGVAATRAPRGDLVVIAVDGTDALDFLHGQVTANLRGMTVGGGVRTAWCSPKGRVLYLLTILTTADGFLILLPAAQCESFTRRLRMFVLRAAVRIEPLAAYGVIALDRVDALPALPEGIAAASMGDEHLLCGPVATLAACWDALPGTPIGEAAALLVDIRRGHPRLDGALSDQFLPQELDLDRHAGVSFEKGCYPGQEIVARVRYRGSVKRRLAHLGLAASTPPASGTRLLATTDASARGTVLMAATTAPARCELLVVLDSGAGTVTLDGVAAALERLDDGDDDGG